MSKKRIVLGTVSVLVLILLVFVTQRVLSDLEQKRQIEEQERLEGEKVALEKKRLADLLEEEAEYYYEYISVARNLDVKQFLFLRSYGVYLEEDGRIFINKTTNVSKSDMGERKILTQYKVKKLYRTVIDSYFNSFAFKDESGKFYLASIREYNSNKDLRGHISTFKVPDGYLFLFDLEETFEIEDISDIRITENAETSLILTEDGSLYSYGIGRVGSLGLGFALDGMTSEYDYEFRGMFVLPTKTVDNYGKIQGNVRDFDIVTYEDSEGHMSVLTNDGKFYVSGQYIVFPDHEYIMNPPTHSYSKYLKYASEIEEIQGKIDFFEPTTSYDLIKTIDGKLYLFGINPTMNLDDIEEEVPLVFYELLYKGKSIDAIDVRCGGGRGYFCSILTKDDLLVYGYYSIMDYEADIINEVTKYEVDEEYVLPENLDTTMVLKLLIDGDGQWFKQKYFKNLETPIEKPTFEDYLLIRPERFKETSIKKLKRRLQIY